MVKKVHALRLPPLITILVASDFEMKFVYEQNALFCLSAAAASPSKDLECLVGRF